LEFLDEELISSALVAHPTSIVPGASLLGAGFFVSIGEGERFPSDSIISFLRSSALFFSPRGAVCDETRLLPDREVPWSQSTTAIPFFPLLPPAVA
jgi:hypothetical protein